MLMTWANGAGPGPWFLLFPLFWIAVVTFAIFAFRGGWRRSFHRSGSAEDVLGERFARGEITADEYRERLGVLRRKG